MVEAADQMWTKGDRNGFVQMLMNGDPTAGQRGAQLTALELPDAVGEAHRVVARYYPLMLQREDQVGDLCGVTARRQCPAHWRPH